MAMARRMCRRWAGRGSWLSVSSRRSARQPSPGRSSTFSSIECDTAKLDVSGSGSAATSRSKVGLAPGDEALRRLLAHDLAALLRVVAGLGERLLVLDHVLGRLDDHRALVVVPGPPGPAGDLVELPGASGGATGCRRTSTAP